MKGVIFNVVEEVVTQNLGEDTWDNLLVLADLDGSYTSLGSYPDAELMKIVAVASDVLATPVDQLLRSLGADAMPHLYKRFPHFFDNTPDGKTFILSLNTIIHPEVRKLYAGASCPHFHFTEGEDRLSLGYNSPRKLCHLAHGFVDGLARHYGETIVVEQPKCMHNGDAMCQLELIWK